jgi:hypothetical protein
MGQQEVAASACPVRDVANEPIPLNNGVAAGRGDQVRKSRQLDQLGETSPLIVLNGGIDERVRTPEQQMYGFLIEIEA